MAGLPSGLVWAPAGTGAPAGAPVREGWVLAPPVLGAHGPTGASRASSRPSAGLRPRGPMESLTRATLVAGVGVEGDRYATGRGRFSAAGRSGQDLTLVEAEALEALRREHGIGSRPPMPGATSSHAASTSTRSSGGASAIGEVACVGRRLAEPCSWLQRMTPAGTLRGLVHRGGLRADILVGGIVSLGDGIEPGE